MRTTLLMICLGVCALGVAAQVPPPPPPPLIWSPPEKQEIKEFVDTANKFKISFAGVPLKDAGEAGNRTRIVYMLKRPGSNSSVMILGSPDNLEAPAKALYESYKSRLSTTAARAPRSVSPKTFEVTLDRSITVSGVEGREFGYVSDFYFTRVALFAKGNLFFEVKMDVTNWRILLDHHPEISRAFLTEADRFISSFEFLP